MTTAAPPFEDPAVRAPLIHGARDFHAITERVAGVVEADTVPAWKIFLCFTLSLVLVLAGSLYRLVAKGIGVWGENTRSAGPGTSPASSSGSVSATPAR